MKIGQVSLGVWIAGLMVAMGAGYAIYSHSARIAEEETARNLAVLAQQRSNAQKAVAEAREKERKETLLRQWSDSEKMLQLSERAQLRNDQIKKDSEKRANREFLEEFKKTELSLIELRSTVDGAYTDAQAAKDRRTVEGGGHLPDGYYDAMLKGMSR